MGETIIKKDLTGDGIPVFSAATDLVPFGYTNKNRLCFGENDVILGARGTIGVPKLPRLPKWTATQTTIVVTPDTSQLTPEWACLALSNVDYKKITSTQAIPMLTVAKTNSIKIPLPPLAEQRRIVARVEELMARVREARRLRQQAREDAERLWQSVLAETFPRPGADLPAGWRWVRLGEVCQHLRSSIDPRQYPEEQFCLYSIPAYDNGREPEHANGEQLGSAKLRVDDGFCLFSKLNPRIPRAWVIHKAHCGGKSIASTEFMPLKPRYDLLSLDFLGLVLLTEMFLQQVRRNVSGATGSRQRLRPAVVLSALVPLPPLSEQRRIVAHLEAVQERLRALKAAQAETDEKLKQLEQSILDKAFRGEL
jgi:type I restriction enzyme S subunit